MAYCLSNICIRILYLKYILSMKAQQITAGNTIPIPLIPEFSGLPISGLAPTHESIGKFQKWNSGLLAIVSSAIERMRVKKEGCSVFLKVQFKNEWSCGTLSNFVCPEIDEICIVELEKEKAKIEGDLQLAEKWQNSQQFKIEESFLTKIFRFYTGCYGEEFKGFVNAIKNKINEQFPANEFYKSLTFTCSQLLLSHIERIRFEFTRPQKAEQLVFKEGSPKVYGLLCEEDILLNILKKKHQSDVYEEYLNKQGKCSSQELIEMVKAYIQIVKSKDTSIRCLNNLVGNEEQELSYRQSEVQNLTSEIKKLLRHKQNIEGLQEKLKYYENQLKIKQRSIVELNKLISNEEEQLMYRENEVEILTEQIKKLLKLKEGKA